MKNEAQYCHTCPVQRECLDYAIEHGENGAWGGMFIPMVHHSPNPDLHRLRPLGGKSADTAVLRSTWDSVAAFLETEGLADGGVAECVREHNPYRDRGELA